MLNLFYMAYTWYTTSWPLSSILFLNPPNSDYFIHKTRILTINSAFKDKKYHYKDQL